MEASTPHMRAIYRLYGDGLCPDTTYQIDYITKYMQRNKCSYIVFPDGSGAATPIWYNI